MEVYTTRPASPDGIGKFFHGREIAKVMGHPAIGWLERDEREREEAPSRAIDALDLPPSAVIADIGAGSGYYSFRIAPKVPLGKVMAVDIQPEMLDFLKRRSAELGITNVVPHLGKVDDLALPPASLDAALLVDAYHEFSHPAEMLASLFRSLKPGGRVFLLEFRGGGPAGADQGAAQDDRGAGEAGIRVGGIPLRFEPPPAAVAAFHGLRAALVFENREPLVGTEFGGRLDLERARCRRADRVRRRWG